MSDSKLQTKRISFVLLKLKFEKPVADILSDFKWTIGKMFLDREDGVTCRLVKVSTTKPGNFIVAYVVPVVNGVAGKIQRAPIHIADVVEMLADTDAFPSVQLVNYESVDIELGLLSASLISFASTEYEHGQPQVECKQGAIARDRHDPMGSITYKSDQLTAEGTRPTLASPPADAEGKEKPAVMVGHLTNGIPPACQHVNKRRVKPTPTVQFEETFNFAC